MNDPKIRIAPDQRFACILCGRCCRRFQVALSDADIHVLQGLDWDPAAPGPAAPVTRINGYPYLTHTPTGDCVYLDPATNICRIHDRFGPEPKPLSCRGYPLNIVSTYWGELSVSARMDCPAVRRNAGPRLEEDRVAIERYARALKIRGGFDEAETAGLSREAVEILVAALAEQVLGRRDARAGTKALAFAVAVRRLEQLGPAFLSDTGTLREVLPRFLTRAFERARRPTARGVNAFSRAVFREWLAAYLRRDEEMAGAGWGARLGRTWELGRICFGRGSFGRFGAEHPDVQLAQVALWRAVSIETASEREAAAAIPETDVWDCAGRFMRSRLETLQFFGVAYYHQPFFSGLRALALSYPLMLAAARYHAAARAATAISATDVDYAVGAIDHSFGRSPLLQMRVWRAVELYFDLPRVARLLAVLGWE